ncbi:restriction endonuclease [Pedobacter alluvionis]|nr:restriction endonuclease [Pedobacter alluvionis]
MRKAYKYCYFYKLKRYQLKKGKEYELLIEQIYRELGDSTIIKQDDHVWGEETNSFRQIDLSIRYNVSDIELLVIVQAKDWKHPADIKVVGEFKSVIDDVKAQKGILICRSGFTKKAIEYAKKLRIDLLSAHTSINDDWSYKLSIPVINKKQIFATTSDIVLPCAGGENITVNSKGAVYKIGEKIYDYGGFLSESIGGTGNLVKSGKEIKIRIPLQNCSSNLFNNEWRDMVELNFSYTYLKTIYLKSDLKPEEYRILKSHTSEKVTHSFVNFDKLMPLIKEKEKWRRIDKSEYENFSNKTHIRMNSIEMDYFGTFNFEFFK